MNAAKRRVGEASHRRAGARAEEEGVAFLTALGFRVLHQNYTVRGGELDVVAMDGGMLVFVEVRSRSTRSSAAFGGALGSVGPKKRRRLVLAAQHYLAQHAPADVPARFDVLYRDPGTGWQLMRDAFRPEEA